MAPLDGRNRALHGVGVQVVGQDRPRRVGDRLRRREASSHDQAADRRGAHPDGERRLRDGERGGPVGRRREHGNLVDVAEADHALLGPRIARAGAIPEAIQDPGDLEIGQPPREVTDHIDHLPRGAPAVLPGPIASHAQRGVLAAGPMNPDLLT